MVVNSEKYLHVRTVQKSLFRQCYYDHYHYYGIIIIIIIMDAKLILP